MTSLMTEVASKLVSEKGFLSEAFFVGWTII